MNRDYTMPNLIFNHDSAVADWVATLVRKPFVEPYTAIGVASPTGKLIGGFVFNCYTGTSVELSLAGYGVVSRSTWAGVLDYVFRQLGCVRIEAHTRRSSPVRKNLAKLGFVYEGTSRRMYGKEDGLCYSLTVDDLGGFCARWRLPLVVPPVTVTGAMSR